MPRLRRCGHRHSDLSPKEGPKPESILDAEVPEKYTLTDHLWNYLQVPRKIAAGQVTVSKSPRRIAEETLLSR